MSARSLLSFLGSLRGILLLLGGVYLYLQLGGHLTGCARQDTDAILPRRRSARSSLERSGSTASTLPLSEFVELPAANSSNTRCRGLKYPRNPVFTLPGRVRDPAVLPTEYGFELYFTHFVGNPKIMWGGAAAKETALGYSVRMVMTREWKHFSEPQNVTPHAFASPYAPTMWKGKEVIAFQAYPDKPLGGNASGLFFSTRTRTTGGGSAWSTPSMFLSEALTLPWNKAGRAIDPTLIVDDADRLHCFFVGSSPVSAVRENNRFLTKKANLLGHAVTDDPQLMHWTVLTVDKPLIGTSARAPDGIENVAIFRAGGGRYVMIYSEGLHGQHLALAVSTDLYSWTGLGELNLNGDKQKWMAGRYGAPYVWKDSDGCYRMALMGEYDIKSHESAIGLLSSADGIKWMLHPE